MSIELPEPNAPHAGELSDAELNGVVGGIAQPNVVQRPDGSGCTEPWKPPYPRNDTLFPYPKPNGER